MPKRQPILNLALLGKRIYMRRHEHRWSQQVLAEKAKINYVTVSKIEQGQMPAVSADTVVRLAKALGTTADYLLGFDMLDEEETEDENRAVLTKAGSRAVL
jgi:transcriptional regulator with XRE-family HTH domain